MLEQMEDAFTQALQIPIDDITTPVHSSLVP